MKTQLQRGFSAVEICIAVFVLAAVGATGYLAYSRMQDASKTPTASEQTDNASTPSVPTVSSSDDLDKAEKALDETNLDASVSDSTELDAELKNF